MRQDLRRHLRRLPPARRDGHLSHFGAHGAELGHALSARKRPGKLRVNRRRSSGRHAYTEAKLTLSSMALMEDLDKETVNMVSNYDETMTEPVVLPAKFPNLLLNGSSGIAVGMATNIPPHNFEELC